MVFDFFFVLNNSWKHATFKNQNDVLMLLTKVFFTKMVQMQTLAVSVAYFIYDLVCCQFDNNVKIDNSIHHLVSIIGLWAGLGYEMVFIFLLYRFIFFGHCSSYTMGILVEIVLYSQNFL